MPFLTNKVALVTGGASGLGMAIVQKLLQNKVKGVSIVDWNEKMATNLLSYLMEKNENHGRIFFVKTDVSKEEEFENAFMKTAEKFRNIDVVINNAGIINELQWEKTVAINLEAVLRGTYLAIDKYLPKYSLGKEGVIVNVSSILGLDVMETLPTYTAAKHGIVGLAKALGSACFYQANNIRILTVCPGVVATPLVGNTEIAVKDLQHFRDEHKRLSKMACSPDYIGDSVVKIINEGEHGSVWVVEDEETPYEVSFPTRVELRKPS